MSTLPATVGPEAGEWLQQRPLRSGRASRST